MKYSQSEYSELGKSSQVNDDYNDEDESEIEMITNDTSMLTLLHTLLKRAVPVSVGYLFMFLNAFITMTYAGHFNDSVIFAGISLATMFVNISFFSLIFGMSSAVDTLASQHFGAGNYSEVGLVLQRSCLVSLVISIPLLLSWFYSRSIFIFFGVSEDIADVVEKFLLVRIYSTPIDIFDVSYERYLSALGVVNPSLYANISHDIGLIFLNYIFIYVFEFGYVALAWSDVISALFTCLTMVLCSYYHPSVQKTLQHPHSDAFTKWHEFASLGMPATLMLCSEWWAYEILLVFAAELGSAEVASQTIIFQGAQLAYAVPLGISEATMSLVGNFLGADKSDVAIRIGKVAISFDLVCQAVIMIIIYNYGCYFFNFYTNDPHILHICYSLVPFLSFFTVLDGLVAVGSGILSGTGKQYLGAVTCLFSFYMIGLPMAMYLCYCTSFGVRGLMIGLSYGTACQMSLLLILSLLFEKFVYTSSISETTSTIQSSHSKYNSEGKKESTEVTPLSSFHYRSYNC
jgi:MATE family multidrug resistance protein